MVPDLEVTIGGVASGLARAPVPGESLGPRQIAIWATVVNRRRKVSLRFALHEPIGDIKANLATEAELHVYGSGGRMSAIPIRHIFEPLVMEAGDERSGNLIFMLHDLSLGPQPFTVLTITDSLSGEFNDIDLTKPTALPAPFRKVSHRRDVEPKPMPAD